MQVESEDRNALCSPNQSMARPVTTPPAVAVQGLEDDRSLLVMQFSSLTAALLGADYSDRIGTCEKSDRVPCDLPVAEDRVFSCRLQRKYERNKQSGLFSPEMTSDGPVAQHSYLRPALKQGRENSVSQKKSWFCEECAQPIGESSGGSVSYCTTCRMLPICRDGSQTQSVPKVHFVSNIGPLAVSNCIRD